jgi:hypothetical protein
MHSFIMKCYHFLEATVTEIQNKRIEKSLTEKLQIIFSSIGTEAHYVKCILVYASNFYQPHAKKRSNNSGSLCMMQLKTLCLIEPCYLGCNTMWTPR